MTPLQAKEFEDPGQVIPVRPGNSRFPPEVVERTLRSIEKEYDAIDRVAAEARREQQPHRDNIKETINNAAENHGIPKKELRALVSKRRLLRRAETVANALNQDQKDALAFLEEAVRDLPLFAAAAQ